MKIELKSIKINESFSEETTCFKADVFINGVKVAYAENSGRGGNTDYGSYQGKKDILKEAEDFCLALPPHYSEEFEMEFPQNLESIIDDLVYQEVLRKERKKLEKKMVNHLLMGVPGGYSYSQVNFKIPLASIPNLQLYVDKYAKQLKEGEVFLNTNLESLGIKL
jgi:hypothetical protein